MSIDSINKNFVQNSVTYAKSEIDSVMKAESEFVDVAKVAHRGLDTFERAKQVDELLCDVYPNYKARATMPKSVFGDQFGYDMQKQIGNCMSDFYSGKKSQCEVQEFFEECCKSMRIYRTQQCQTNGNNIDDNAQIVSQIYEVFAKENQRAVRNANYNEGLSINNKYGGRPNDCVYYNSDYYYRCEDTKETLRGFTQKVAEGWKLSEIDTQEIEDNSKLTLDGGFDFNSGWNWLYRNQVGRASLETENFVPPRDFKLFYKEEIDFLTGVLDMKLNNQEYHMNVPFSISHYGDMKGQIYDLNELLGEAVKEKSETEDFQDFLKNIVVFRSSYAHQTKLIDIFGDYKATRI